MAFQSTTGLGVAAKLLVEGNTSTSTTPGKNPVLLSLSGTNGPTTLQLNPQIVDVANNPVNPGTAFTLSAVAASSPGALTLTAAALNGVYTGTITGGGSNAFAGQTFIIAGFTNASNNGTFICTASTTTTLTLVNANSVAETHAGTATPEFGTAVYTGTITGGGSNAFAGQTFVVTGFTAANNNGTFIATASTTTTLTLENPAATAVTAAGTATSQETTNQITYVAYGFKTLSGNTYVPSGSATAVVSVSATGLITALAEGGSVVEASFPTFNNTSGTTGAASPNPMHGLPLNKIYGEVSVTVLA